MRGRATHRPARGAPGTREAGRDAARHAPVAGARPAIVLPTVDPLAAPPAFLAASAELGIQFDPGDLDRLGRYLALLLETTKSFNLTAITDPDEAWTKHILDALSLVPLLSEIGPDAGAIEPARDEPSDSTPPRLNTSMPSVIDIGSGGGLPGIPLAIVLPHVRVTLLEATGKKVEFLRAAAQELGLGNITVIQGRAEALGQDFHAHREKYDAATVRAVGHLAIVAELAAPLVRPGGLVLAVKGAKADEELAQAATAIGLVGARHAATVPTPTGRIIVLEKATRTPRTYPRRDGEPKRTPLGL